MFATEILQRSKLFQFSADNTCWAISQLTNFLVVQKFSLESINHQINFYVLKH